MKWPQVNQMKKQIQDFQEKVQNLQEVDVGDFRRRLDLYINRLKEDITLSKELQELIQSMKHETLYEHSEIEDIREAVLQKISFIQKKI